MLNRVDALAEACEWIRRLWTEDDPFDFTGGHVVLTGAVGNPKPQRPHPPLLIGGRSQATLRVVAQHADMWNMPGGDLLEIVERNALLNRLCGEVGRDTASIVRSVALPTSYEHPAQTRAAIAEAVDAASRTLFSSCPRPFRRTRHSGWRTTSSAERAPGTGVSANSMALAFAEDILDLVPATDPEFGKYLVELCGNDSLRHVDPTLWLATAASVRSAMVHRRALRPRAIFDNLMNTSS
ncbi:LLM class flavin-dependent oxidoreductase [Gordonia sputi]|uniref:LLM class flavin-dependent oxidoreductase n=1 Tax=Gordonia sputi TaxID=36823 RepID=UPI0035588948